MRPVLVSFAVLALASSSSPRCAGVALGPEGGDRRLATVPAPPSHPPAPADAFNPPEGGLRSASGVRMKVLQEGSGQIGSGQEGAGQERPGLPRPGAKDLLAVHFTGWHGKGECFADTRSGDGPALVFLETLMPGMREALSEMVAGERRRLWIPEAQGFAGAAGKPAGALCMDVELVEVMAHPSLAPSDVASIPSDAQLRPSGLAFKVLRPGRGEARPTWNQWVEVHYSGWTTDGRLFDSSWLRRQPQQLRLTEVIDGWKEGLQLMTQGERRRFWVPQKLAYRGEHDKPKGMLVFDVELLGFHK